MCSWQAQRVLSYVSNFRVSRRQFLLLSIWANILHVTNRLPCQPKRKQFYYLFYLFESTCRLNYYPKVGPSCKHFDCHMFSPKECDPYWPVLITRIFMLTKQIGKIVPRCSQRVSHDVTFNVGNCRNQEETILSSTMCSFSFCVWLQYWFYEWSYCNLNNLYGQITYKWYMFHCIFQCLISGAMVNLRELGTLHFFDTVYVYIYIYTYIVDRYVNDPIINDDTLR